MEFNSVVLPAPKNPVRTVTGILACSCIAVLCQKNRTSTKLFCEFRTNSKLLVMHRSEKNRGLPQSKTYRRSRSRFGVRQSSAAFSGWGAIARWLFQFQSRVEARGPWSHNGANQLVGRWQGLWMSDYNGHNGKLRCLIRQTSNGTYNARYHAKYRKILGFGYSVPLKVQRSNDVYVFSGEANLGNPNTMGTNFSIIHAPLPVQFGSAVSRLRLTPSRLYTERGRRCFSCAFSPESAHDRCSLSSN
jgi:hypothetical protein